MKFHLRTEIAEMSKIIGAAIAFTVMVVAILAWSKFAVVDPQAAAATNAAAGEGGPMISPSETMIKRGKDLPFEDWRPAN
jgi:low affinity Fe/Cu permease